MVKRRGDDARFPVHRERQLHEPWLHRDKVNAAASPCTDRRDRGYLVRMGSRGELGATSDSRLGRLRGLIAHAYDRVPFYRERFDRVGVRPADIRTLADIARLPIVEKRELADAGPERITAAGHAPAELLSTMTSGYSGEPLVIRRTTAEQALWARSWLTDLLQAGLRRNDRIASVFFPRQGHPDGLGPLSELELVHETHVDCTLEPAEIVAALREVRPTFLRGLAGVV